MPEKSFSAIIRGTGTCLPERVVTNDDLSRIVDTSDEWIRTRSGIRERRFAADDEFASDLGAAAGRRAIAAAGLAPGEIGGVIVATMTPDLPFPATACLIGDKIGINGVLAFDVSAACSGFIYALRVAEGMLAAGGIDNLLVIGTEKMSSMLDFQDRGTCVLFGDGAGAVVLSRLESDRRTGILSNVAGADGSKVELLYTPAGGARLPASAATLEARQHYLKMNGREVFKLAVRIMGQICREAVETCGMRLDDVDLVIAHQANLRIIESLARHLDLPMAKFHNNLDRVGNTSGASIPIAIDEALASGRIRSGDRVLLVAFGGGLTWAACLIEWA